MSFGPDDLSLEDAATLESFMAWEDGLTEASRRRLGGFPTCLVAEAGLALKALSVAKREWLAAQRGGRPATAERWQGE